MTRHFTLAGLLLLAGLTSTASAHYLWVAVSGTSAGKSVANIYFEESPAPGTGEYLEPIIATGKTWIRTIDKPKPQPLETKDVTQDKKRWLVAELPQAAPRCIDMYAKFGVYRYGQTDVLLHYYARYLDVTSHEDLHELGRAEQLRLDLVAHDEEDRVEITLLWEGQPAKGRTVHVRGPKGFNQNLKTDDNGVIHFKPETAGRYTIRSSVEEDKSGRDGDKDYSQIRHHATLVLNLPLLN